MTLASSSAVRCRPLVTNNDAAIAAGEQRAGPAYVRPASSSRTERLSARWSRQRRDGTQSYQGAGRAGIPAVSKEAGQGRRALDWLRPGVCACKCRNTLPVGKPVGQLMRGVHGERRLPDPGHTADRVYRDDPLALRNAGHRVSKL